MTTRSIAVAILMTLICALPTSAVVFTDDFNDNSLNPAVWLIDTYGAASAVEEQNQRLEFTIPASSVPTSSLAVSLACTSRFLLRGDFDVQVDYALLNGSSFDNGGIGLTTSAGQGIWRYDHAGTYDVYGFAFEAPTSDTAGTLRLARQGATATAYYYSAGGWVTLGSSPYTTNDVYVAIEYHNYIDEAIRAPLYLAVDDFTLNEGQIVQTVPEPSSVLALFGGMTYFATIIRRRRS